MSGFRVLSAAEQVAKHLLEEIARGRWANTLPGVYKLADELTVNHKTVGAALKLLENQGHIEGLGAGHRRRITPSLDKGATRSLRVGLFYCDPVEDRNTKFLVELRHTLAQAGHVAVIPNKSLQELKMDVKRIARAARSHNVDAWMVMAGSVDVLKWFAEQPIPSFAIAGRQEGIDIAGAKPDGRAAFATAANRLVEFGHRRIVLLCRTTRRKPDPGRVERAFLNELEAQGIRTGDYNLPDWEETPDALQEVLKSLFSFTPPTAMVVDEPFLFAAAQQFLARKKIQVPDEISMICTQSDPSFSWARPSVTHFSFDSRPWIRRILRWTLNVSRGKTDRKQFTFPAEFVEGGSIGPAKG